MNSYLANFLLFLLVPVALGAKKQPNVVIMFMDDMGYADIGPFGAKGYPTPHLIDGQGGRKFTDFYVTQAVCSASRAVFSRVATTQRVGIMGALGPKSNIGINPGEVTIAEICKQKGYATACYGKWHLGHLKEFLPMQHGFDEYFGLPYSNDMWPYHPGVLHLPIEERLKRWPDLPLMDGNKVINPKVTGKDQEKLTTQYTERAVSFIEKNKDKPFFVYVPHSMVHVPLSRFRQVQGQERSRFVRGRNDGSRLVGRSDHEGPSQVQAEKDTLFVFTSDNGLGSIMVTIGSASPLRRASVTMFDGLQGTDLGLVARDHTPGFRVQRNWP